VPDQRDSALYYEGTDCSGTAYVIATGFDPNAYFNPGNLVGSSLPGDGEFFFTRQASVRHVQSVKLLATNECFDFDEMLLVGSVESGRFYPPYRVVIE